MIARTLLILMTISLISGCSVLGKWGIGAEPEKVIQVVSKPVEIEIIQPTMPRPLSLESPQWYVVSEAVVPNLCKQVPRLDEAGEPELNEDGTPKTRRPKVCAQEDKENPTHRFYTWGQGAPHLLRMRWIWTHTLRGRAGAA